MKAKINKQIFIGFGIGVLATLIIALGIHFFNQHGLFFSYRSRMENHFRHGIVGSVSTINQSSLTVKDRKGQTINVLVDSQTSIMRNRSKISLSDIKIGDQILVIGDPDQTNIKAKLIRVVSRMPMKSASPSAQTNLNNNEQVY